MRLDAEHPYRYGSGSSGTWTFSAAITAAVIAAGGAAYAANRQAKAQREAAKAGAQSSQSGTTSPYREDLIQGDINNIIALQRQQVAGGVPQLGPNGQIYYAQRPGAGPSPSGPPAPPPGMRRNARGQLVPVGKNDPSYRAANQPQGGKGPTGAPAPSPARPATPDDIFRDVAARGLAAGNTGTQTQARNAVGGILGAAGGGGPEVTGFEGYNPILDRQALRLEADADSRVGRDLLLGFLDENGRGTVGANPNGSGGTGSSPSSPGSVRSQWVQAAGGPRTANQFSGVPDTMAVDSFFGTETRKIMDEQANEAELADLISRMNADVEKGMFRDLASLDAAAQGTGRLGGGMWKGVAGDAREEAASEMAERAAGVRVGDRESRRAARLAALQGVNTRDLGLLNANVQREGIDASRAASASAAQSQADQLALAHRGQDLSALGTLLGFEQGNMSELTDIGQQLSGDRISTLGLVPGLEGIGLQGLGMALGGGGGLVDMRGQDVQSRIAGQQAGIARAGLNQQAGMFNASQGQQQVNDYLRTVLGIGGMGTSSASQGNQTIPSSGSQTGQMILSGLGAGLSTFGAMGGFAPRTPAPAAATPPPAPVTTQLRGVRF